MTIYQNLYQLIQTLPETDGGIHTTVKNSLDTLQTTNIGAIMAFPVKVGGTFLRTALIKLLSKNYTSYLGRGSYASTDQSRDLYFPSILHHYVNQGERASALVAHCHMYATKPVTSIVELFKIPVLVNTRNILDTLVSYNDMVSQMHRDGIPITDDFILQTHDNYADMSEEERRWNLVNVAPIWYSRFYAYWIRYTETCIANGTQAPFWTKFDELRQEPEQLLSSIVKIVDPANTYTKKEIRSTLKATLAVKDKLRFNKGVSNRGEKYFTAEEQKTIHNLMASTTNHKEKLIELGVL